MSQLLNADATAVDQACLAVGLEGRQLQQQQQSQSPPTVAVVGAHVQIHGLVNAAHHNGKVGVVVKAVQNETTCGDSISSRTSSSSNRVGVKLQDGSGKILAVKLENIRLVVPKASGGSSKEGHDNETADEGAGSDACTTVISTATAAKATATTIPTKRPKSEIPTSSQSSQSSQEPKQRELKRQHGLLTEFDGSFDFDPNTLVLYYHFRDQAFDCYNSQEYQSQLIRYLDHGMFVRLVLPRMIRTHKYWLIGLQHTDPSRNVLCDVAFQAGRSFTGISMLVKHKCFACGNPNPQVVELCKCHCACFCNSCTVSKPPTLTDHERCVCGRVDVSKITIEDDCIQLVQ
jgi:hypothetical protein